MSDKDDKRQAAKQERIAAEASAAHADAARRRQRLFALLGATALVTIIAVVLLVVGNSGDSGTDPNAAPTDDLAGVTEQGIALGDPDAPVTMVEFADPQCPFCAEYTTTVQPDLVDEYVKSGQLRMELRFLTFIGPDSLRLANSAYTASLQDGLWKFSDLAYARQGAEGSGYADDSFIESVAIDAGLDPEPIVAAAEDPDPEVQRLVTEAKDLAATSDVASTPSFLIGPTGGDLQPLDVTALKTSAFEGPIDDAIAAADSSG